jgi:hypothetical protein
MYKLTRHSSFFYKKKMYMLNLNNIIKVFYLVDYMMYVFIIS